MSAVLVELNVNITGETSPVDVEFIQHEVQFTVEFGEELSAIAALKAGTAADRLAVESALSDSLPVLQKALDQSDVIVDALTTISDKTVLVQNLATTVSADQVDVAGRHTDIKAWHDAHDTDKDYFSAVRDEMVASETGLANTLAEIDAQAAAIQTVQSDITTKHTEVNSRHIAVETFYDDIAAKHSTVVSDTATVVAARQDIETRQADVTARQNAIIALQTQIDTAAANYLAAIRQEGADQTLRVTTEGDTQLTRIAVEGQSKVDLATTQANVATSKASDASASAVAAAGSETSAVNIRDDVITRQADIATKHTAVIDAKDAVEADRAEVAANKLSLDGMQADVASKQTDVTTKHGEISGWHTDIESDRLSVVTHTADTLNYRNQAKVYRDEAETFANAASGGLADLGSYDASVNTLPTKPMASAFWKITVAGTLDSVEYGVGDTLIYSKTLDVFYKIDNTESVPSVNGKHGIVVLTYEDVGARSDTWVPMWSDITGVPALAAAAHNHDDLYYTEAEVDAFLATKADSHAHPYRLDTWVPAWTDITGAPDFAVAGHDHSSLYYSKAETDNLLANIDALPDQTSHAGKFLQTDGTHASWSNVDVSVMEARIAALEALTANMSVNATTTVFAGEVQATDLSIGNP